DRLVAQLLKESQLPQRNCVPQVDVDAGRVDAILDAERLAGGDAALKFRPQRVFGFDLLDAAADQGELLLDAFHSKIPSSESNRRRLLVMRCRLPLHIPLG